MEFLVFWFLVFRFKSSRLKEREEEKENMIWVGSKLTGIPPPQRAVAQHISYFLFLLLFLLDYSVCLFFSITQVMASSVHKAHIKL